MTGPTHRKYAVCFAFIFTILLYRSNTTEVNYYLLLIIMLEMSKKGAIFPDLDHTWHNVSEKTLPNRIVNVLIKATGGKHRSWQTHSIDICVYFTMISMYLPNILYNLGRLSSVNREILSVILMGFASGWISHLFSDMLTPEGVRVVCFSKVKIKIVPKKLLGFRFSTGSSWEEFLCKFTQVINYVLGTICLIYPYIDNILNLIQNMKGR